MLSLEDVRHIQVELTTKCNARCPMCMRNYRGMEFNSGYPDAELTLEQFQHIVTPEVLKTLLIPETPINGRVPIIYDFRGITFNGNLGDFSAARDGLEIVQYIVEHGVPVSINTNGSLRSSNWWGKLAMPGVEVGFALDGLADTHSLYRQDTDWNKVIKNAQTFIAAGGRAVWRFIPFEHNRHQEDACRQLAQDLGFSKFENIYDGRDNTPVFTRDGVYSHQIGIDPGRQPDHVPDIRPLLESHITWYKADTVKSPKDTDKLNIQCVHARKREIYIAADGTVYPCCFLGFYPTTMNHPGNRELAPLVKENNALEYPLEHCLQWFNAIEETWSKPSIAQGRTYQCIATCNRV